MGGPEVKARNPVDTTSMSARERFGGYKSGKRQRAGESDIKEDHILEQLKRLWREHEYKYRYEKEYHIIFHHINESGLECSADDVARFSLALEEFQDDEGFSEKAGLFLSVLIKFGKDEVYTIHTQNLEIDFLGFYNHKTIFIEGDAGDCVGQGMGQRGKIFVNGSAGDCPGFEMEGGELIIEKDAGDKVGIGMKDGKIHVKGNAGHSIGYKMSGGEVYIDGEYLSLAGNIRNPTPLMFGGKVYNKGELVFEKQGKTCFFKR